VIKVIDALEDAGQHRLDLEQALPDAGAGLGDLEDLGFGFVEQQADFPAGGIERVLGDLGGDLRQASLD